MLLNGRTGSCGTIPLNRTGYCVYVFSPVFILFYSWRLVLHAIGFCASTLGPVAFLALYYGGEKGQDVFDEEVALVVSNILPLS